MIQAILSHIAIIILMFIGIELITRFIFSKNIINFITIMIGSTAIISMFYIPISHDLYSLDLRLVPFIFFALFKNWKITINILFITSIWRYSMGGMDVFLEVTTNMVIPTMLGLILKQFPLCKGKNLKDALKDGEKCYGLKILTTVTISWLISIIPILINIDWKIAFELLFVYYLSISLSALLLFLLTLNNVNVENSIRKYQYLAEHDKLTGLYNRDKFLSKVQQRRYKKHSFLILIDIDYFKKINDQYGHLTGDKILKDLANYLKSHENYLTFFGRYGGEEFIGYHENKSTVEAINFFTKLGRDWANKTLYSVEGTPLPKITISMGVKELNPSSSLTMTVEEADKYLYIAKESGRNCTVSEKFMIKH